MSNLGLFCILALLICYIFIFGVKANEVALVELNDDGTILDNSQLPRCDGSKIKLLSYSYSFICRTQNNCDKPKDIEMSNADIMTIHEMCSLKQTCVPKSVSGNKRENVRTFMKISYKCLGMFVKFVDICENSTFSSNKMIHCTTPKNSTFFEKCECILTTENGHFLTTLDDVRLQIPNSDKCSPAKLQVHVETYGCDGKDGIFNKRVEGQQTSTIISFTMNSTIVTPEMVYLTVQPKDNALVKVSCKHQPRIIRQTTKQVIDTDVTTKRYNNQQVKETVVSTATASVVMLVVGAGITLLVVFVCISLRRKQHRKLRSHIENLEKQLTIRRQIPLSNRSQYQYSFAKDEIDSAGDKGDYVSLEQHQTANETSSESEGQVKSSDCIMDSTLTQLESKPVAPSGTKPKFGLLKKALNRAHVVNESVYSYATNESLLRPTEETENIGSDHMNPPYRAGHGQGTHSYFKLEPTQDLETDCMKLEPDEAIGTNGTCEVTSVEKKSSIKKHQKQKESNATREGKRQIYDKAYNTASVGDVTRADDFPSHVDILPASLKNVTANKEKENQKKSREPIDYSIYETIDTDDTPLPQKPKSSGFLRNLESKPFKPSKAKIDKTTNSQSDYNKELSMTTTFGAKVDEATNPRLDHNKDVQFSSETKAGKLLDINAGNNNYDCTYSAQCRVPVLPNYDHVTSSKSSRMKKLFSKNRNVSKTKETRSTTDEGAHPITETCPVLMKQHTGNTSATCEADDDHYDKLKTVDVCINPVHPNYDRSINIHSVKRLKMI